MDLHEDKDAFEELIGTTAETLGLPQIYVEKDYWVIKDTMRTMRGQALLAFKTEG